MRATSAVELAHACSCCCDAGIKAIHVNNKNQLRAPITLRPSFVRRNGGKVGARSEPLGDANLGWGPPMLRMCSDVSGARRPAIALSRAASHLRVGWVSQPQPAGWHTTWLPSRSHHLDRRLLTADRADGVAGQLPMRLERRSYEISERCVYRGKTPLLTRLPGRAPSCHVGRPSRTVRARGRGIPPRGPPARASRDHARNRER